MVNTHSSKTTSELEKEIMSIFRFDAEDLRFNREGRISKKQKSRLQKTAGFLFIGFLLIGAFITSLSVIAQDEPINELPLLVPAFIMSLFGGIGIFIYWLSSRMYRQGVVKSITGKISFELRNEFAVLCIGNERFLRGANMTSVLEEGVEYRVYYTPADMFILSIERVDYEENA